MEVKPGYKQTGVGVIPQDWDVRPMGDVYAFQNGVNANRLAYGHGVPFINVLEVISSPTIDVSQVPGRVVLSPQAQIAFAVKRGDVLFNRTSETQEEVGLASVYVGSAPVVFGGFVIRAQRRNAMLAPSFSAYLLRSRVVRSQIVAKGQGAVRANIGQRELSRVIIPIPPAPEQDAIAEVLSDADALIESLEQLIAKKRQIKQGAMQELLTGKRRLPGFGGEWKEAAFGTLAQPRKQRIDPSRTNPGDFCVELEHIEQATGRLLGYTTPSEDSSLKSAFAKGDVLFGKLRAYLRKYWLADRPGVCSTEIWVLAPNPALVTPEFLFQLVAQDRFVQAASSAYGTHMPRSDWNVVNNLAVTPPAIPEQTAIAVVLSDMDLEINVLETKLAKTRQIKHGMMQELLTGRIRLL